MNFKITHFFSVSLALIAMSIASSADPSFNVGTNACLFLDDHFIAKQSGLTRTWHQGKPRPEIAIEEKEPWENWPTLWGSCFYDPKYKVYRMYYQTTLLPSGEPGISFRDNLCYAESKDAKTWVKPKLGLVEFNGSKDNNILISFAGPPVVMIDPLATEPAGRLKMFTYVLKKQPVSNDNQSFCGLQSEDGIHWLFLGPVNIPGFAKAEEGGFNDLMPIMWDGIRKCYLGNFRTMSTHTIGELASADGKTKNVRRRAIGITRTSSQSPLNGWAPSRMILKADDEDDRRSAKFSKNPDKPEWAEMYVMPMFTYGNHYFGLITFFDKVDSTDCNGGGDLQLAYSNDGENWHRALDRKSAVEHTTDNPELFPNFAQFNPPLDMGNEIWIFYSENNGTHGVSPFDKSAGRIRAAVWRKDGFVSLDAGANGSLTTKPVLCGGKELLVNCSLKDNSGLRVAVLDVDGNVIPGYDLAECSAVKGDSIAAPATWMKQSDLESLVGKPVRLHFEWSKGQLWSFRFKQ